MIGDDLIRSVSFPQPAHIHITSKGTAQEGQDGMAGWYWHMTHALGAVLQTAEQRAADLDDNLKAFMFAIPKV